ncbi:BTAD domain-containing putative transcriptional regulator [Streptomyces lichenis]|uniref:BTAD domain-containing putative transcriptional regulator n=1 Tax=Streptomyces lichenis TaxID=2306967 RepID=UPI0024A6E3C2|nr:BTAD domain-containing putative transcriptional regulator [Streptomyces lichenis]
MRTIRGSELRTARTKARLTQEEVARRASVSVRTIRHIEHGQVKTPRRETLTRIAEVVGWRPADPPDEPASAPDTGPAAQEIRVLGPLAVLSADRPVPLPSKQRALLGLLAVQPDRTVSHEEIADVLWNGEAPPSYPQLVHTHVARLRRIVEPSAGAAAATVRRISTVRGGYVFNSTDVRLDLCRFEDRVALARRTVTHEPLVALDLYGQALHCWQGRLLHDLPQLWHHPSVVRVAQRHIDVAIESADLALRLDRPGFAVEHLRTASYEEPLHEPLQARIMLALAGSGRRAAALQLFAELRTRLKEELDVEPGDDIRRARETVLRGGGAPEQRVLSAIPAPRSPRSRMSGPPPRAGTAGPVHPAAAPAGRSPSIGAPAQLPLVPAPFTGRAGQLTALDHALLRRHGGHGSPGIAVVHGPADIGKSALVVRWAHHRLAEFPDGQLYASLQGSMDPEQRTVTPCTVVTGFIRSLGVRDDWIPDTPHEVTALFRSLLAGRRFLVVLDDVETASEVRCLLPGTPGNAVVATSRSPLADLETREGAHSLGLGALTAEEAHELIVTHLGAERTAAEPGAAEELAAVCGRLPLPLRRAVTELAATPSGSLAGLAADLARTAPPRPDGPHPAP